jgi:hypothetical protein
MTSRCLHGPAGCQSIPLPGRPYTHLDALACCSSEPGLSIIQQACELLLVGLDLHTPHVNTAVASTSTAGPWNKSNVVEGVDVQQAIHMSGKQVPHGMHDVQYRRQTVIGGGSVSLYEGCHQRQPVTRSCCGLAAYNQA